MKHQQADDKPGKVYYQSWEFFDKSSMPREVGWYFNDEEGYPYGPFLNKKHCEAGLQIYLKQLEKGESPTQLSEEMAKFLMNDSPLPDILN